jgi:hypothetical protein
VDNVAKKELNHYFSRIFVFGDSSVIFGIKNKFLEVPKSFSPFFVFFRVLRGKNKLQKTRNCTKDTLNDNQWGISKN